MPLRHGRSHRNQRIELIVTASVRPVWSGQHLEHIAQRQEAPTHSTPYFAITIEGTSKEKKSKLPTTVMKSAVQLLFIRCLNYVNLALLVTK